MENFVFRIKQFARGFMQDRKGVTALEYGLIAALIAGVIVTAVTDLGSNLSNTFNNLSNSIKK